MTDRSPAVDEYIAGFPDDVGAVLERVRAAVHRGAPGVTEAIGYQMPAFRLDGRYLVYVGGWKAHVGLYPVLGLDADLEAEVAPYRSAKGTLRFPLKQPLPDDLIVRVVAALAARRVEERAR